MGSLVKFGMAAAAIVVVAIVLLATVFNSDGGYTVRVELADAGGLLKNYNVKIGQVPAGKVTKIDLDKHDNVWATVKLDDGAYPIGKGASARVRPVNLLGEKYLDLDPGNLKDPVKSGYKIHKDKTGVPVELDDVLNTLDPDTRASMRILINEAGLAMMGRGTDFNRTLRELPPALDQAREVVGEVASENRRLRSAIVRGDSVVNAVTARRDDLGQFIDAGDDALSVLADRQGSLSQTVRRAPAAFTQLRHSLLRLQGASQQLTPAAVDLRRASPSLADTLRRTPSFARNARGTLRAARVASPALYALGKRSRPTLRRLRPTSRRLSTFLSDVKPIVDESDKNDGLRAFLGLMDGWTGVTDDRDGLGHSFRLRAIVDNEIAQAYLQKYCGILGVATCPNVPGLSAAAKSRFAYKGPKQALRAGSSPAALRTSTPAGKGGSRTTAPAAQGQGLAQQLQRLVPQKTPKTSTPKGGSDVGRLSNYLLGP